ncbi:MAG: hypothetical protein ABUK01_11625 [Leptospirales bacterium]
MKRTDIERRERELKRAEKKTVVQERKSAGFRNKNSAGEYIAGLAEIFFYNDDQIFNIQSEVKILEMIEEMKADIPEKNWETILRKAIKKTGVSQKEKAFEELKEFFD